MDLEDQVKAREEAVLTVKELRKRVSPNSPLLNPEYWCRLMLDETFSLEQKQWCQCMADALFEPYEESEEESEEQSEEESEEGSDGWPSEEWLSEEESFDDMYERHVMRGLARDGFFRR